MRAVVVALLLGVGTLPAAAGSQADALRRQAIEFAYNLDHDQAAAVMKRAVDAEPGNPANHLGLASVTLLKMVWRRGSFTVEEYLGPPPRGDVKRSTPPADLSNTFLASVNSALRIAELNVRQQPNDPEALYLLGAAVAYQAAYTASEEGKLLASIRAARRAFDMHERVLQLDPRRKDAAFIVASYRYLVTTLSLFKRWLAYLAGFGGDKPLAVRMLEESAAYPSDVQADARFTLLVVYTREELFEKALGVLRDLRALYPRNRLFWLETGAACRRAGRPAEALAWIDGGLARLAADSRPRAFGEDAMWHYERGLALAALRRGTDARAEADRVLALPGQAWVRGRVYTLLGHAEDLAGNRPAAERAYRRAVELAGQVGDEAGVQDAARWLDNPFTGTSAASSRQYQ